MNIESNINQTNAAQANETDFPEIHADAYEEGWFFAQTDWPWALRETYKEARPASMAQHRAVAWAFVTNVVCPEWAGSEHAWLSFLLGYEDGGNAMADAGEAEYQALAEAGTVDETDCWILQAAPWKAKATRSAKALRAVRAAWDGAAAWLAKAEATGRSEDRIRADEAQIRAEAAGDAAFGSQYVPPASKAVH